jgi:hypothetical protein
LATVVIPFTFSTPVALVPGQLYVIQDLEVSGHGLVGSSGINNYAGGTQILDGVAQPGNDLWIQEGIEIPEPGALLLLGTGLAGLLTIDFLMKLYIFCTS